MKIISLIYPSVKCHGQAAEVLGKEVIGNGESRLFEILPVVKDTEVSNMPEKQDGAKYLVNIYVFNSLKDSRDDLIAFDDSLATRGDDGKVISHGGVLLSQ